MSEECLGAALLEHHYVPGLCFCRLSKFIFENGSLLGYCAVYYIHYQALMVEAVSISETLISF
jgi:hypothetical protein